MNTKFHIYIPIKAASVDRKEVINGSLFLIVDRQLCKRPYYFVGSLVRWSIGEHKSKSGKTSALDGLFVSVGIRRGTWGEDEG